MYVRTVFLAAIVCLIALVHLVVVRVVLFLLPAMAVQTSIFQVAPVTVSLRLLLGAPEAALFL